MSDEQAESTVIYETCDYGVILQCNDVDMADQIEDFFTEQCFVLFKIKIEPERIQFLFGQASSLKKVTELYERSQKRK